jgi:hypothetical protein
MQHLVAASRPLGPPRPQPEEQAAPGSPPGTPLAQDAEPEAPTAHGTAPAGAEPGADEGAGRKHVPHRAPHERPPLGSGLDVAGEAELEADPLEPTPHPGERALAHADSVREARQRLAAVTPVPSRQVQRDWQAQRDALQQRIRARADSAQSQRSARVALLLGQDASRSAAAEVAAARPPRPPASGAAAAGGLGGEADAARLAARAPTDELRPPRTASGGRALVPRVDLSKLQAGGSQRPQSARVVPGDRTGWGAGRRPLSAGLRPPSARRPQTARAAPSGQRHVWRPHTARAASARPVSGRALSIFAASEAGGSAPGSARPVTAAAAALEFRHALRPLLQDMYREALLAQPPADRAPATRARLTPAGHFKF